MYHRLRKVAVIDESMVMFEGPCFCHDERHEVTVPRAGVTSYNAGARIQDAFPDLSADEREFLISGLCKKGWDETFGEGELHEGIAPDKGNK